MEFRDIDRKIYDEYYVFHDFDKNVSKTARINYLKYLICKDKNFFDPYILLSEIYLSEGNIDKGYRILKLGYNRMLKNVFDGKIPSSMNWYEINNRHLFRLIYNYADILWFLDLKTKASRLFSKLIKMHQSDNIGARYALIAIQEGYINTNHLFLEVNNDVEKWFKKHYANILK